MRILIGLLLFGSLSGSVVIAQSAAAFKEQTPPASMTFDVISIHPIKMEPGHFYPMLDGGFEPANSSHYRMRSVQLLSLLGDIFSLKYYQLPIESLKQFVPPIPSMYVIEARGDEETDRRLAALPKAQREAEQRHMILALLEDRFHLKLHWEARSMPGFRLVVDKHGSKLLPAGSLPKDVDFLKWKTTGGAISPYHVHSDPLRGNLTVARGVGMDVVLELASFYAWSPVVDETGLHGLYDFDLKVGTKATNPAENPRSWPSIADALQSELGLRLEPVQVMQKVPVIDHLEAPTSN